MRGNLGIRLVNLTLAIVFAAFAVAAVISLLQQSYLSGLLLLLATAGLLLSRRLSDQGRVSLLLFLLLFYLAAYATNVFLIFTSKKGAGEIHLIEQQRLEAARQAGRSYDTRTPLEVVADLRAKGTEAVPMIAPLDTLTKNGLLVNGRRLLPLAGISQKTTVFCNECGSYSIYQADEHGFNNPAGLWPPQSVDLLLIGDSFCHGGCVPPGDDVGGRLREAVPRVLNLGMSAEGPLLELATLREYGPAIKPGTVLWLYFEGNDLTDLEREKNCPSLIPYLKDESYTQDLIHRQGEIDQALSGYLGKEIRQKKEVKLWYRHREILETLRSFQLKNLKSTIRLMHANLHEYLYQENLRLFQRILGMAQDTVHSWGGTLYFVYLPAYQRYTGQARLYPLNRRDLVIAAVQSLGLPLIDFHPVVAKLPDPLAVFPYRKVGHYNKEGYRLLAQEILRALPSAALNH